MDPLGKDQAVFCAAQYLGFRSGLLICPGAADVCAGDRLGRLALNRAGIASRGLNGLRADRWTNEAYRWRAVMSFLSKLPQ